MADLNKFYSEEVEPKLFPIINALFPEFTLNKSGKVWESPYKFDGVTPSSSGRGEKTIISDPSYKGYEHINVLEHGNASKSLLSLYMERNSLSFLDAVKALAKIAEVELPEEDPAKAEVYNSRKKKQERLRALLSQMNAALFAPEAAPELRYLKEKRGYSEEYIKSAPIGYISTSMRETLSELKSLLSYEDKAGKPHHIWSNDTLKVAVGYTHKIAIAYIAAGEIKGFSFRTLLSEKELEEIREHFKYSSFPKYLTHPISEYDSQRFFPIALPTAKLTAYNNKYLNFTLVEGLFDTYKGLAAGIPNVIGLSQGGLTQWQLEKLKAKGAESVTIMKDTEARLKKDGSSNEASIKENKENVRKAINLILSQGLKPYVLYLPEAEDPTEKVDLDSYLDGSSNEALQEQGAKVQEMIDRAESGFIFLYSLFEEKYNSSDKTPKEGEKFLKETLKLINREECNILDKKKIYALFAKATGITLSDVEIEQLLSSDLGEDVEDKKAAAKEALQEKIAAAAQECSNDPKKAKETLQRALSEYEAATAEDLSEYRRIKSQEERKKEQEEAPIGIYTDFTFYTKEKTSGKYNSERMLLPAEALTYICAPSGHGKTRLLENLALQVLRNEKQGSVLFFTLEESGRKIENAFLNLYINEHLSNEENNILTLKKYKSAKTLYEQRALFTAYPFETFLQREKQFNEEYIHSGRLRIYYEPSGKIEKIEKIIHYLKRVLTDAEGAPIKAVFIDYIQRLKPEINFHGDKKQEMNAVTEVLMRLSVELKIPFVLSVQLNRDARSPLEMDIQNIADAAEIERSGSVILLGYNCSYSRSDSKHFKRAETPEEEDAESTTQKIENTPEAVNFFKRTGIRVGLKKQKFYALLAKNRDGEADLESVFFFYGNTGTITQGLRAADVEAEKATSGKGNKEYKAKAKTLPPEQPLEEPSEEHPLGEPRAESPF